MSALTAARFYFDLLIPLGVASGVPYAIPVLLSLASSSRRFTWIVAAGGIVLVGAGFYLSPPGGTFGWWWRTDCWRSV